MTELISFFFFIRAKVKGKVLAFGRDLIITEFNGSHFFNENFVEQLELCNYITSFFNTS